MPTLKTLLRAARMTPGVTFGIAVVSIGLVWTLSLVQAQQAAIEPPATVIVEKDVPYAKVGNRSLFLDLARPKNGDGPFPVVVCIHGGGWRAGDKKEFLQAVYSLAAQGYVAATVQYRFAPDHHFPSQIQDVKAAVRYLRSRAKGLKLDPDRIGVLGGSAGGHLALLLGTADAKDIVDVGEHLEFSSKVQAVASVAGPCDLTQSFPQLSEAMVTDLIGKTRKDAPEMYRQASPIYDLDANDASILTIHGTKDELVPYEQSTSLVAACKKLGIEAELHTIPNGGHGTGGKPEDWAAGLVKMVAFFDRHLKQGKTAASKPTSGSADQPKSP